MVGAWDRVRYAGSAEVVENLDSIADSENQLAKKRRPFRGAAEIQPTSPAGPGLLFLLEER